METALSPSFPIGLLIALVILEIARRRAEAPGSEDRLGDPSGDLRARWDSNPGHED
jgi:hypothetical protein